MAPIWYCPQPTRYFGDERRARSIPNLFLWAMFIPAQTTMSGTSPSVVSTRSSWTVISPFMVSRAFFAKLKGSMTLFPIPSQSINWPHLTSIVHPFLTNFSIAPAPSAVLFLSIASLSSVISFLNLPKNHSFRTAEMFPKVHSLFMAILRDL